MTYLTVLAIALGLAMDAFSVAIAAGAVYRQMQISHVFRLAFCFGFFQMFMPVIGWFCASSVKACVAPFCHWVVYLTLLLIGGKMIYDAIKLEPEQKRTLELTFLTLIALSVATSLDALAMGVPLSLLNMQLLHTAGTIGLTTLLLSLVGVYLGKKFGHLFEKRVEILGGVVIILIGFKVLFNHLG